MFSSITIFGFILTLFSFYTLLYKYLSLFLLPSPNTIETALKFLFVNVNNISLLLLLLVLYNDCYYYFTRLFKANLSNFTYVSYLSYSCYRHFLRYVLVLVVSVFFMSSYKSKAFSSVNNRYYNYSLYILTLHNYLLIKLSFICNLVYLLLLPWYFFVDVDDVVNPCRSIPPDNISSLVN